MTATRSLLFVLAAGVLLTGCEEDMGQDNWLRIENNTGERVYVLDTDEADDDYIAGIGPGQSGFAAAHERCDDSELVAHSGSITGPVVATRSPEEGRDCTSPWVIGPPD